MNDDRRSFRQSNPYAPYDGWRRRRRRERLTSLFALVVLVAVVMLGMSFRRPKTLVAIYVNQKPWVYVKSEKEAKEVRDIVVKKKMAGKKHARLVEHVTIKVVPKKTQEIDDHDVAITKLDSVLTVVSSVKVLLVNGKPVLSALDDGVIKAALEKIRKGGVPAGKGPFKTVAFKENVQIVGKDLPAPSVSRVEEALAKLQSSSSSTEEKFITYTVKKGDMAWAVAQKNKIPILTLKRLNLQVDLKSLRIGEKLKISSSGKIKKKIRSLITVVAKKEVREKSVIQPPVVMKKSDKLFRGEKKVLKEGKPGTKEEIAVVVYENGVETRRKFLWRKVTKKPAPKVIQVGTKLKTQTSRFSPSIFGRNYGTKMAYLIYMQYRHGNYKGHFRGVYGMKELGVSVPVAHSLNHAFGVHFADGLPWEQVYAYLSHGDRSFGGRWGCSGGPHDPYSAARWIKQYILAK